MSIQTNIFTARIIQEQSKVYRIINKVIITKSLAENPNITIEDIYQDICLASCKASEKTLSTIDQYFYRNIKQLAIQFIRKELRHVRRFRMVNITGELSHKKLSHPSFSNNSDLFLSLSQVLTPIQYQAITLYYIHRYTLDELTKTIGQDCRRVLIKAKQKIAEHLSINDMDNKQLAYFNVRLNITKNREKMIIHNRVLKVNNNNTI